MSEQAKLPSLPSMNFLQHKREIQLTQSTRCDFMSAVLSNKFLYKVWSPTPFERTFVYG